MNKRRGRPSTYRRLQDLDLNLLLVLDALLLERNVSRAATRLGRSQPAVSNALARLRTALADPLFVRTPKGVTPTERALLLAEPLAEALERLGNALGEPAVFQPSTAKRTFLIAASDHAQLLFIPALAERMTQWAGIKLRVLPLPREFPLTELERGELDLVIGAFDVAPGDSAPSGLQRQLLSEERFAAVARRGHPALKRDLRHASVLPQLNVSPRGGTWNAAEERAQTPARNIVLFVPHYLVAPWVLSSTELLAALPERLAERFCEVFPLERVVLEHAPTLKIHQLWHPRAQSQPAHRWLRAEVLSAAREPLRR